MKAVREYRVCRAGFLTLPSLLICSLGGDARFCVGDTIFNSGFSFSGDGSAGSVALSYSYDISNGWMNRSHPFQDESLLVVAGSILWMHGSDNVASVKMRWSSVSIKSPKGLSSR